ncbi:AroM family protein [Alicyclobacillus macrosporangiidus]|uniref:Protein AroM n=1 Tax=Alicyclobacillus macrosporangiidus TaxID=392015 RepID=A0A1I7LIQ8_9BACL|nr:AroM family protein [Alicyclobacillus macrosporangiidus]SFV09580.1 protein AroM [Alicyclobacillus macrosporangiidus]
MRKIGAITIGQSPRVDIIPELQALSGPDAEFLEMGALDGLSPAEVAEMRPQGNDEVLVTRMRDGSSVIISDSAVIPRLQGCIEELQRAGVSAIALLCTGTFPVFQSRVPILVPEHLLLNFVRGMKGPKPLKLGVLTPDEGQFRQQEARWRTVVEDVILRAASPYDGVARVVEEGHRFSGDGVDAVVLDCMGYSGEMKDALRQVLPCPVILARSVLGRFAAELA